MKMHSKAIVWNNPDTGVASVCHPVAEAIEIVDVVIPAIPAVEATETIEAVEAKAELHYTERQVVPVDINAEAVKVVPAGVSFDIVDRSSIPTDRNYRDAWESDSGEIKGNVERAKAAVLKRMRAERDANLLTLDREEISLRGGDPAELYARKDAQLSCTDGVKDYTNARAVISLSALATALDPLSVVPSI